MSREEISSPMLTCKILFNACWFCCYYSTFFASSTILLSLFSITLYIEVERNASCFFLEALTLTTVLSFVYSSLFTYQQGCEVPGLVCSLLLLQQHWYTALDLMICCHQPQVMKWRKCVTRNTNLPDFRILSLIQNVMNLCF